tara:strand:- start:20 stop:415 length:396 start_codon:yes stop_codon:yes gene_type:complete
MNLNTYGSSGKKGVVKPHLCKECGETDPLNFYGKQKIVCKKCHSKGAYDTQKATRAKAIEYKGGCCSACGYKKYHGALQFHHMDPTQKDPKEFKRGKNWERFKAEIDKCVLLCANCHAEEHERIRRVGRVA